MIMGEGDRRSDEGVFVFMRKNPIDKNSYTKKAILNSFAKSMRKDSTDAEKLLWNLLRDKRFMGHKFRRQHVIDCFIIDFYCKEKSIGIELDGGQHNQDDKIEYDNQREMLLHKNGIRIVRFWNNDVLNRTKDVLELLAELMK
jgi:very-short-patch-repair endonuclease